MMTHIYAKFSTYPKNLAAQNVKMSVQSKAT